VPDEPDFVIGNHYVRRELHDQFKGNRQKGISSPSGEDFVFIFTGPSGEKYGYDDELREDGTLLYYGEGRVGPMEFTANNGNTKVRDHAERGLSLYVFEETATDGVMSYVGEYEYENHEWTEGDDQNNDTRDAIRFILKPAGGDEIVFEDTNLEDASVRELFEAASESMERTSRTSTTSSGTTYNRSELPRKFALKSADGICQGCGEKGPFYTNNGERFLEVHHLRRLSDGGPDRPENVIALCPNCHRKRHRGRNGDEFNEELIEKAEKRNKRLLDSTG
jgi:5-methylcytosine-specific restriction protein A